MSNNFDFHLHSTASDGSETVSELLESIKEANIQFFSLTDHDTLVGTLEMEKIVPDFIHFVRGIEFSCKTPYHKCHILGYDFNPEHPSLSHALDTLVQLRRKKLYYRVAFLEERFGIVLNEKEADWLFTQASPGKPHFGKIIVERGLAPDINSAIEKYIKPCKDENDRIDAQLAVQAILDSGGIPVWAHPLGGEGEKRLTKKEFYQQLDKLISHGIRGLECYYSRYTKEEIDFLVDQAQKHNLLISGGSDYHGKMKKNLHIGKLNAEDVDVDKEALTLYNYLSK